MVLHMTPLIYHSICALRLPNRLHLAGLGWKVWISEEFISLCLSVLKLLLLPAYQTVRLVHAHRDLIPERRQNNYVAS